jgi:hypothetical protein
LSEQARGEGDVIQTFGEGGRYGVLKASPDAKKILQGIQQSSIKPPKGRTVTRTQDQLDSGVPGMTEEQWDEHQAKNRTIKARVHCTPPFNHPLNGYWSAKRFFPAGVSEQMLSPQELEELEGEQEHRIKVEVLSGRPKQVQVQGDAKPAAEPPKK